MTALLPALGGGLGAEPRTASAPLAGEAKAELPRRRLAHFQPDGDHASVAVAVAVDQPLCGRMPPGIRVLRLEVTDVPDVPTARRQRRRPERIGPRKP
ncbi:hypothetical protein ABT373_29120 [Streptomyces sp. NPDC000070]|uniref:hypothetical protein n=1 Tax=Streptomyces sp. NPDC000070 TaxID=3154240 RepID=UPI00331E76AC